MVRAVNIVITRNIITERMPDGRLRSRMSQTKTTTPWPSDPALLVGLSHACHACVRHMGHCDPAEESETD